MRQRSVEGDFPAPLIRTRCSVQEESCDDEDGFVSKGAAASDEDSPRRVSSLALSSSRHRENEEYDEDEVYSEGMRNLLLNLEKTFESSYTSPLPDSETNLRHDPVVGVLQRSLSMCKRPSQGQKKKKVRLRTHNSNGSHFQSRLPDIDEDMSLHATPSLDEREWMPELKPCEGSGSSQDDEGEVESQGDVLSTGSINGNAAQNQQNAWTSQVRVQSQLPDVEVSLLRRSSSLPHTSSLRSQHTAYSLSPSMRSTSTACSSEYYYYDDESDDGFSAFTRLRSYSSLQTNASSVSYAFQEVDEEDDILPPCHAFAWFGGGH